MEREFNYRKATEIDKINDNKIMTSTNQFDDYKTIHSYQISKSRPKASSIGEYYSPNAIN